MSDAYAGEGQVFVCAACGRTGKTRYGFKDTSCITWAVLCWEEPKPDLSIGESWLSVESLPAKPEVQEQGQDREADPDPANGFADHGGGNDDGAGEQSKR